MDRRAIRLQEYEKKEIPDIPYLSPNDKRLARELEDGAKIFLRRLFDGSLEIKCSQWIGIARFEFFDIIVEPRLIKKTNVLQMLEYSSGFNSAKWTNFERPLPSEGIDLADLICLLIAQRGEELLTSGLIQDYRFANDSLPFMRGHLNYRDQMLKRFGRVDVLECSFDEYDTENLDNKIVADGLYVALQIARDSEIRHRVRKVLARWEQFCTSSHRITRMISKHIRYGRRNRHYKPAHHLSFLLFDNIYLGDFFQSAEGTFSSFFLNMSKIFEDFVTQLLKENITQFGLHVDSQRSFIKLITQETENYSTLRPDLAIYKFNQPRIIPVDAKYKDYENSKTSSADLYQSFIYAYGIDKADLNRQGIIIHPSSKWELQTIRIQTDHKTPSVTLSIIGLDVETVLQELRGGKSREVDRLGEYLIAKLDNLATS